jgi:hypothetical protein
VIQTEASFNSTNYGARLTMIALLGSGPICSGSS